MSAWECILCKSGIAIRGNRVGRAEIFLKTAGRRQPPSPSPPRSPKENLNFQRRPGCNRENPSGPLGSPDQSHGPRDWSRGPRDRSRGPREWSRGPKDWFRPGCFFQRFRTKAPLVKFNGSYSAVASSVLIKVRFVYSLGWLQPAAPPPFLNGGLLSFMSKLT